MPGLFVIFKSIRLISIFDSHSSEQRVLQCHSVRPTAGRRPARKDIDPQPLQLHYAQSLVTTDQNRALPL